MNALGYYAAALLLTIALELPIAAIFGYRRAKDLAAVALVSVFTHPILTFALGLIPDFGPEARLAFIVALEIGVVIAEWKLLVYALRRDEKVLRTSVVMNAVSFLAGLALLAAV